MPQLRFARFGLCLTRFSTVCLVLFLMPITGGADDALAPMAKGSAIYQAKCAVCHGERGEGTKDYPTALTGDKSVRELATVISNTMPEGEPELCTGEDAEAVAAFIHHEFYSVLAQARNRPASVEFSRLTVRQFENAVTDLIGSFGPSVGRPKEHGLKGEYFNLRSFNGKKRVYDRVDPVVDFQFHDQKPEGFPTEPDMEERRKDDIHDDAEFSIRWSGSLIAPETGDYEFILESENGVRLFLNDGRTALCDAWVSSGNETTHRSTIHLLGGRRYPLRLEFFRYKQKSASIQLKWKRPKHTEEVIPSRFLTPEWSPELFVLTTPFPPDDRSVGYERGTSVSKGWQDAAIQASLETSRYVVDHLPQLAKAKPDDPEYDQKVRTFCEKFVERAFRRPVPAEEMTAIIDTSFQGATLHAGVKRLVLRTMLSPQFLYREHGRGHFDSYALASWLSFTLWDSIPDQVLLKAAQEGKLETPEQVRAQVNRMLPDLRTQFKLQQFFRQWLQLDRMPEIVKDQQTFAGFDTQLVSDLRTSLELFLNDVLTSDDASFQRLFLDNHLYLNGRLAAFYGEDLPADAPFQKVASNQKVRMGVVTHPLLLSGLAYSQESSPIHRGVFIARSLLGRRLKPPPIAVAPLAPDLHADLTTRARVLLQTSPPACQSCHSMINNLGFSLEHFDAAGRFREEDNHQPVDADGKYLNRDGEEVSFEGAADLAHYLADSPEAHESFTEQLFQYTVKQPIRAFGPDELQRLREQFAEQQFNIRKLLAEIAASSAIRMKQLDEGHEEAKVSVHP